MCIMSYTVLGDFPQHFRLFLHISEFESECQIPRFKIMYSDVRPIAHDL